MPEIKGGYYLNTSVLTEALRKFDPEAFEWKLALYSSKKTRDGIELDWNLCRMRGINVQTDKIREFLLKKPVSEKTVSPYTPFLSDKENIGALERSDGMISEQLTDIILTVGSADEYPPEDFINGTLSKTAGYAFIGEKSDDEGQTEHVIFMKRGNPFLNSLASQLFVSTEDNEIAVSSRPLLKLVPSADFVLIGGTGYFFSAAAEKDFGLEDRHFAVAGKHMEMIAEAGIAGDYEWLERSVMTAKNARKFLDFDQKILDRIVRLSIADKDEFLSKYGVELDKNGRIDTSDTEQCELLIDLLCCRSCIDPLGRLAVGSNITPRE